MTAPEASSAKIQIGDAKTSSGYGERKQQEILDRLSVNPLAKIQEAVPGAL